MDAGVLYGANFWKTGDDWTVFDSSNITADVTFEAGKTYLVQIVEKIKGCADNPWDVGVGDEALHEKVKVKLTVSPTEPD